MDTTDQDCAYETLDRFMSDPAARTCLLTGAAGTGKTYMLMGFLKRAGLTPGVVKIAAPTNKAVAVLQSKLDEDYHASCQTIHRHLNSMEQYGPNGEMDLQYSFSYTWNTTRLLVVDESSMLCSALFRFIVDRQPPGLKTLFVGDLSQLPPVDEEDSPAFTYSHPYRYNLHIVKRTQNPDIAFLYSVFRGWQTGTEDLERMLKRSPKHRRLFVDATGFKRAVAETSPDTYILAYSNDQTQAYNRLARRALFPGVTQAWTEGDRGYFTDTCIVESHRYHTNDMFTVDSLLIETHDVRFPRDDIYAEPGVRVKTYLLYNDDGAEMHRVHEHDVELFERYVRIVRMHVAAYASLPTTTQRDASECWKAFHSWRKQCHVPIDYAYAVTVHKSQGSGFRRVLIDARNIEDCTVHDKRLFKKCIYTAVTRATDSILIYW